MNKIKSNRDFYFTALVISLEVTAMFFYFKLTGLASLSLFQCLIPFFIYLQVVVFLKALALLYRTLHFLYVLISKDYQ